MEKKSSKEYSVVFLVEGEKFNLGEKYLAKSSNLPYRFCSNSVGTLLEFAAFRSGFDGNVAELVLFGFFCPQPWFLRRSEHIFSGKTPAFSC